MISFFKNAYMEDKELSGSTYYLNYFLIYQKESENYQPATYNKPWYFVYV